ncbi:MAG: DUF2141 domain-containing protein [Pseudomonadota bacterium]|nr:DUF2141 domain-containing protein [Pseudomonadota bacterium]
MLRTLSATLVLMLATQAATAADLRVKVDGITKPTGTLIAMLVNSTDAWDGTSAPVSGRQEVIAATGSYELVFKDLAPGDYAIRVMHDDNGNGELDRSPVGMPTEGYGFSNNPSVMRAATFEEARFTVPMAGASIAIALR